MLILLFCFIAGLSCYFPIISGLPWTACYFCYFAIFHHFWFTMDRMLFLLLCYFAIFHHYWFTHGQHAIFAILLFSIITGLLMDSMLFLLFCYFAIFHHYWFTHGQHAIFAILLFSTIIPIVKINFAINQEVRSELELGKVVSVCLCHGLKKRYM